MIVDDILNKYTKLQSELLYDEAVELSNLFSDEEFSNLLTKYPAMFKELSNSNKEALIKRPALLSSAVRTLANELRERNLTIDEYNAMSLDKVKEYISKLVVDKSPLLFNIINTLENDLQCKPKSKT